MKVRFQADNDLRQAIRKGVVRREPAVDFQSAHAARLDTLPDLDVLRLASVSGRVLVSHDVNTLTEEFRRFVQAGHYCSGVLLVPQQAPTGAVIESLLLVWLVSDPADWENRLVWLPFQADDVIVFRPLLLEEVARIARSCLPARSSRATRAPLPPAPRRSSPAKPRSPTRI